MYTKKRGSLYLLLVPHFEALALPSPVERATQKPTPMIYTKNHVCQYRAHTLDVCTQTANTECS